MNLQEYQTLAIRTAKGRDRDFDLLHAAVGFNSETTELIDAISNDDAVNMHEEIGDKFWYLAFAATILEIELTEYDENELTIDEDFDEIDLLDKIVDDESTFANIIKRIAVYNKNIDKEEIESAIENLITDYQLFLKYKNIPLTECLTKNINKLKARFPEKYSDEKALNRDLDNERKILEK